MRQSVLLRAALAFPLAVYALFRIAEASELGGWFHEAYPGIVLGALPVATIAFALLAEHRRAGLRMWPVMAFFAWIAAVLFAHVWLIAQASGGV